MWVSFLNRESKYQNSDYWKPRSDIESNWSDELLPSQNSDQWKKPIDIELKSPQMKIKKCFISNSVNNSVLMHKALKLLGKICIICLCLIIKF